MTASDSHADLEESVAQLIERYGTGRWDSARALSETILRRQPRQFDALYLKGLIVYRTGDRDAGRALVEKACRIAPRVRRFSHGTGLLKHLGQDTWLEIQESLYKHYKWSLAIGGYVISYPKCGRTWIRLLLGRYLLGDQGGNYLDTFDITAADPRLPTIHFSHDDYPHHKSHTLLHEDKSMYEDKLVAFLARDPRDVVVSYFFQYTKRGDCRLANDGTFRGTLSDFVRHHIGGITSIVKFYNIWARNRHLPAGFRLFRYEDFHADPRNEFRQFLKFFNIPDRGHPALDDAVSFADFANMRRLEQTNALDDIALRPPRDNDPEAFKVRRGIVGGYRDHLSADDIAFIDDYLERELDDYYACYKNS